VKYYPAFIDLKHKKAVVIGGGRVAERKVRMLVKANASVKVISPVITANIRKLKERGAISHIKRNYRRGDLKNAFIVIAGTSSAEVNARVARDAAYLVNVVDVPSRGNYIVPSVVNRGPLSIAISSQGASPAVSKAIRKELEKMYGPEFRNYLRFLALVRELAAEKISHKNSRERFLQSLASEKVFDMLRDNGFRVTSKNILASLEKLSV
jgi:precorrin-2 dehydrogenase/sirohydrochlorin ferrochelatase